MQADEHDYVPREQKPTTAAEDAGGLRSRDGSGRCKIEELFCHVCGKPFKSKAEYLPLNTASGKRIDYHVRCRPTPTDWRDSACDDWLRKRPKVVEAFRNRDKAEIQKYLTAIKQKVAAMTRLPLPRTNKRPSEGGPGSST